MANAKMKIVKKAVKDCGKGGPGDLSINIGGGLKPLDQNISKQTQPKPPAGWSPATEAQIRAGTHGGENMTSEQITTAQTYSPQRGGPYVPSRPMPEPKQPKPIDPGFGPSPKPILPPSGPKSGLPIKTAPTQPNYTSPQVSWSSLHPGQTGPAVMVPNPYYGKQGIENSQKWDPSMGRPPATPNDGSQLRFPAQTPLMAKLKAKKFRNVGF